MVTIVVIINTLISIVLLYLAWQLGKLKQRIGCIADEIKAYEIISHRLLYQAPESLTLGQLQIKKIRDKKQVIQLQITQMRRVISVLLLAQRLSVRCLGKSRKKIFLVDKLAE